MSETETVEVRTWHPTWLDNDRGVKFALTGKPDPDSNAIQFGEGYSIFLWQWEIVALRKLIAGESLQGGWLDRSREDIMADNLEHVDRFEGANLLEFVERSEDGWKLTELGERFEQYLPEADA